MRYALFLAILLLLAPTADAHKAAALAPACKDDDRSEQAIESVLQEGNDSDSDVNVKVVKICGGYAKATVTTIEEDDIETAYLKKTDGEWTVLNIGTGTDLADLHIPKEVW